MTYVVCHVLNPLTCFQQVGVCKKPGEILNPAARDEPECC